MPAGLVPSVSQATYQNGVNILLDIPGSDSSLPPLYLTAHYDSVTVSPGANDNMSGVIAVLEILRRLKADIDGGNFRRTLKVRFWDQEEQGLIGAAYYLKQKPELNRENVYGVLNLDTIGYFSATLGSQTFPSALRGVFPAEFKQLNCNLQGRSDFILAIGNPGSEHLLTALNSNLTQREGLISLLQSDQPGFYSIPTAATRISL